MYKGDFDFVLMHYPIASWHNMNDGVIHLHGHVHLPPDKKLSKGKAMDVGVDGNGMQPYSINEIISIMNKQPISKLSLPQDHHEEKIEGSGGNKRGSSSF
jgi:calcineurin-like phosphoesterase family protein